MDRPKVSVLMITYNHERFIAEAIDSVLMQETDFDVELVIGEDCSTDRTREIVLDYERKYPDTIRLLLPEQNLGMIPNFVQTYEACRGEYIALLEGDDYWTDLRKLQKQVDFLESMPSFVACSHNAEIVYEDTSHESHPYCTPEQKSVWAFEDTLERNPFPTASMLFRNRLLVSFPEWFFQTVHADSALYILLTQHGPIGYLNEAMSVYRIHRGGIVGGMDALQRQRSLIRFYRLVSSNVPQQYRSRVNGTIMRSCANLGVQLARLTERTHHEWSNAKTTNLLIRTSIERETKDLQLTLSEARAVTDSLYEGLFFLGHLHGNVACVRFALPRAIRHNMALVSNIGLWSIAAQVYLGDNTVGYLRRVSQLVRARIS